MMDKDQPSKLFCVKSAGPLYIGELKENKGFIVASEVAVFQNYTTRYRNVPDSTIVEIDLNNLSQFTSEVHYLENEKLDLNIKPGYKTFLE